MKKKILIVSAPYYKNVVDQLVDGAKKYLQDKTEVDIHEAIAPGAFEIPYIINNRLEHFDAFIALGCIIRGETYHFELIANEVTRKIIDLSLSFKKPIGFGILTCDNIQQAKERSNVMKKDKGGEAARACYSLLLNGQ